MIRPLMRSAGLGLAWLVVSAHVGSPDTWFEGSAGPYRVIVQVTPAGVVPGVAKVFVRSVGDVPASVSIQTDRFDATGAAPPPEPTVRVAGEVNLFAGQLWIMTGGSNSVIVNVAGPKGTGRVIVPVVTVPNRRLDLARPMAAGLSVVGVFLLIGLVTIVGAAVREGSIAPGEPSTDGTRRRARNAMALTSVLLCVLLFGGWKWWTAEDEAFVQSLYKPLALQTKVSDAGNAIEVSIADSAWIHRGDTAWLQSHGAAQWTPLVEDHGKLMHLFAIRDDMSAFAHLHPSTVDSVKFVSPLPSLPEGRYRVFADIVHESGFTHTMVTSVEVPARTAGLGPATANPDDSWFSAPVTPGLSHAAENGTTIQWRRDASGLIAGRSASLTFEVRGADGLPATLEPYMGMAGHAVVQRNDGSVFVHLHPMGTISMASQMAFEMRQPGDTIRGTLGKRLSQAEMSAMNESVVTSNVVSFPYAFPKGGNYRIWVQVKQAGKILTTAFDASVAEQRPRD